MLYFGTEVLEVFSMMEKLYHPSVMKFLHCWESNFHAHTTAPSWMCPSFLQKFLLRDNGLLWYWNLSSIKRLLFLSFNYEKALSSISFEIPTIFSSQLDVKKCVNFKICGYWRFEIKNKGVFDLFYFEYSTYIFRQCYAISSLFFSLSSEHTILIWGVGPCCFILFWGSTCSWWMAVNFATYCKWSQNPVTLSLSQWGQIQNFRQIRPKMALPCLAWASPNLTTGVCFQPFSKLFWCNWYKILDLSFWYINKTTYLCTIHYLDYGKQWLLKDTSFLITYHPS